MCAVSYREVNEVARAIDADITVVSLEPTSIEGILNTITTVGAMTEAEDAAIDLVETLRERLGAVAEKVQARRDGGGRSPRVVGLEWLDPPFATGHWVPEQIRQAGGWELLGSDGDASTQTTWDAVSEVDPEMLLLMPCGFHLQETIDAWAADEAPARLRGPHRRPARTGLRRSTARPTSAGPDRGSSTGSSCWPRSSILTRSWTSRPSGRGRRSTAESPVECRSARPSTACGAAARIRVAAPTISRAGRSSARTASARPATTGSSASACARPSTERGAAAKGTAAGAPRRRDGRRADTAAPPAAAAASDRDARSPTCSPTTRPARPSTTTGTCAAGATRAARSTTRPGTPSSTRPGAGSTRCRSRGEIVELAAGTGWWSPLLASKGELSLYDARAGAARPGPRAARRPRPARASPRARRLGRARSRRSTPCSRASG